MSLTAFDHLVLLAANAPEVPQAHIFPPKLSPSQFVQGETRETELDRIVRWRTEYALKLLGSLHEQEAKL